MAIWHDLWHRTAHSLHCNLLYHVIWTQLALTMAALFLLVLCLLCAIWLTVIWLLFIRTLLLKHTLMHNSIAAVAPSQNQLIVGQIKEAHAISNKEICPHSIYHRILYNRPDLVKVCPSISSIHYSITCSNNMMHIMMCVKIDRVRMPTSLYRWCYSWIRWLYAMTDVCRQCFLGRPLQIVGTNFDFRGPAHQICPPPLVGNIVRRNYIQNIWREEANTRMYP